MNFETKNGLYLDLDSLYDTRLATLESIDPRLAKTAIANGYYKRDEDVFPHVDKKTFRELYDQRGEDLLETAMVTNVLSILSTFIKDSIRRVCETPSKGEINVFLNVYPYQIDKTTAHAMLKPLSKLTAGSANVHILNLKPEHLTLRYCRDNFSLMVMYDFEQWLEIHTRNDAFRNTPIPDITLFVPELYLTPVKPTQEELREVVRQGSHPFRSVERMAKHMVGLSMIEIEHYCANIPPPVIEEIMKAYKKT